MLDSHDIERVRRGGGAI